MKRLLFGLAAALLLEIIISFWVRGSSDVTLWDAFRTVNLVGIIIVTGPLGGVQGAPDWAMYLAVVAGTLVQLFSLLVFFRMIAELWATRPAANQES
jgi:hypothetical protein